jgi:hypothetical protein
MQFLNSTESFLLRGAIMNVIQLGLKIIFVGFTNDEIRPTYIMILNELYR